MFSTVTSVLTVEAGMLVGAIMGWCAHMLMGTSAASKVEAAVAKLMPAPTPVVVHATPAS